MEVTWELRTGVQVLTLDPARPSFVRTKSDLHRGGRSAHLLSNSMTSRASIWCATRQSRKWIMSRSFSRAAVQVNVSPVSPTQVDDVWTKNAFQYAGRSAAAGIEGPGGQRQTERRRMLRMGSDRMGQPAVPYSKRTSILDGGRSLQFLRESRNSNSLTWLPKGKCTRSRIDHPRPRPFERPVVSTASATPSTQPPSLARWATSRLADDQRAA